MAASGSQDSSEIDSLRAEIDKKAAHGRGLRRAWVVFLAVGLPAGLLAALAPLTMAGIYLEPLRPLWQPWPPDVVKPFLGIGVFCATLAYLSFWSGHLAGLRSGTVAAFAALRNVLERRSAAAEASPSPPPPPQDEIASTATADTLPTPPPPSDEASTIEIEP